jgi:hypothetical protein
VEYGSRIWKNPIRKKTKYLWNGSKPLWRRWSRSPGGSGLNLWKIWHKHRSGLGLRLFMNLLPFDWFKMYEMKISLRQIRRKSPWLGIPTIAVTFLRPEDDQANCFSNDLNSLGTFTHGEDVALWVNCRVSMCLLAKNAIKSDNQSLISSVDRRTRGIIENEKWWFEFFTPPLNSFHSNLPNPIKDWKEVWVMSILANSFQRKARKEWNSVYQGVLSLGMSWCSQTYANYRDILWDRSILVIFDSWAQLRC